MSKVFRYIALYSRRNLVNDLSDSPAPLLRSTGGRLISGGLRSPASAVSRRRSPLDHVSHKRLESANGVCFNSAKLMIVDTVG